MKNMQETYNENKVDEMRKRYEQSGKDEDVFTYWELLCDVSIPYFESKKYELNESDMETVKRYGMEDLFYEWKDEYLEVEN